MADAATTDAGVSPDAEETILTVTPAARDLLAEVRAEEPAGDGLGVRIEAVDRHGAVGYDLSLEPLDRADATDVVEPVGDDLTLMVPAASVVHVRGATLDVRDGGFVLDRPDTGAEPPGDAPPTIGDPDDPVAVRVGELLANEINPALAAHGGRADLVGVENGVAYVNMSGGCQGCGLAAATLRDGIQAMILDAVPEITEVVDATDHAAGTNPYYAP